jgi:sRNA-binding carbon storage regulator CsrA
MLVLKRHVGQGIHIGKDVHVTLIDVCERHPRTATICIEGVLSAACCVLAMHESIAIGGVAIVRVVAFTSKDHVKLGIDADRSIEVWRDEVWEERREMQMEAMQKGRRTRSVAGQGIVPATLAGTAQDAGRRQGQRRASA